MRGDRLAGLHETEIGEYLAGLLGCHELLAGLTRADFTDSGGNKDNPFS